MNIILLSFLKEYYFLFLSIFCWDKYRTFRNTFKPHIILINNFSIFIQQYASLCVHKS